LSQLVRAGCPSAEGKGVIKSLTLVEEHPVSIFSPICRVGALLSKRRRAAGVRRGKGRCTGARLAEWSRADMTG
jgi:hypothetical protein